MSKVQFEALENSTTQNDKSNSTHYKDRDSQNKNCKDTGSNDYHQRLPCLHPEPFAFLALAATAPGDT